MTKILIRFLFHLLRSQRRRTGEENISLGNRLLKDQLRDTTSPESVKRMSSNSDLGTEKC